MGTFENSSKAQYTFSSCENCDAMCCDGRRGTIFSQLLLSDFHTIAPYFPILFLIGEKGFLKPVVLLTNGESYCKYLQAFRCSIYEKRPNVCQVYPLSPHLIDIPYIDTYCPAVNAEGSVIVDKGVVQEEFQNAVFDGYKNKYIAMHKHFEQYNKRDNLELFATIRDYQLFAFTNHCNDEYIKLHLESLKNFDEYYIRSVLN